MKAAASRVWTMVDRYVCLHFRNPIRIVDLVFWPTMELLVWGFLSYFLQSKVGDSYRLIIVLLTALIFWDVLFRSQQATSLAFMEELWTRNVLNLFISPLRTGEWVAAICLYGLIKTGIVITLMMVLAALFYSYSASVVGFYFVPLMGNLLLMGWGMGLFTTGLLLRWGHAAEALIWAVPFLVQPFSAIFYPLDVYPDWLRPFCLMFPSTHVMEGMREVIETGAFSWRRAGTALGLNALFIGLFAIFFRSMLERGRANGQLVRITG
jgi:ABC-2 type transport system permease protein